MNNEERRWLISKLDEIIKTEYIQPDDTANVSDKIYDLTSKTINPAIGILGLMLFFSIGAASDIWKEGFTFKNISGCVFVAFILGFCLYYYAFDCIYRITLSNDEKKLVLKSLLKTKTVFVEDIKLLEFQNRGKDPQCTLHMDTESISFPFCSHCRKQSRNCGNRDICR